ncbi:hypothetical protein BC831DRAFT_470906 [Entophlyctis helioformis]|nr:hypothetical protein BC831DRAFT_470906 [Entophlyctis helioformis]
MPSPPATQMLVQDAPSRLDPATATANATGDASPAAGLAGLAGVPGFRPAQVHQCVEQFGPSQLSPVAFQIITLVGSVFVWVGCGVGASDAGAGGQDQAAVPGQFAQLAVAMPPSRLTPGSATASTLIRPSLESHSENVAKRLSTRFKMQAFVSISLDAVYDEHLPHIERRLHALVHEAMSASAQSAAPAPTPNSSDRLVASAEAAAQAVIR